MNRNMNERLSTRVGGAARDIDAGLRAYMLQVYNYMTIGLGMTGVIAYLAAQSPELMQMLFATPLKWVVIFAPLGLLFFLSARLEKLSVGAAQAMFFLYSAMIGLAYSTIFIDYTGDSIARVFFITGGTFGAMSLYGYTTKKDLTGWGSFLLMGLIGLIIAIVVNLFMQSTALDFVISAVGVLIFTGLTAYDTQQIKSMYGAWGDDSGMAQKTAIHGALHLYLDFINLFIMLLRFFGDRR